MSGQITLVTCQPLIVNKEPELINAGMFAVYNIFRLIIVVIVLTFELLEIHNCFVSLTCLIWLRKSSSKPSKWVINTDSCRIIYRNTLTKLHFFCTVAFRIYNRGRGTWCVMSCLGMGNEVIQFCIKICLVYCVSEKHSYSINQMWTLLVWKNSSKQLFNN